MYDFDSEICWGFIYYKRLNTIRKIVFYLAAK